MQAFVLSPISQLLEARGHTILDFGCMSEDSCDYPDHVRPAAQAVASEQSRFRHSSRRQR